jgi:hypothetical protein
VAQALRLADVVAVQVELVESHALWLLPLSSYISWP